MRPGTPLSRRRLLAWGLAPVSLPAWAAAAARIVQPWPSRPIQLVVAYPPGGVSDDTARVLAAGLSARLGVAVVVRHRPGASGAIALEHLSRAPADGHTLVWSAITPLTVLPLLGRLGFDPLRDIAPVIGVMATPVLLLATPALAAPDLPSALDAARRVPGGLRWASSGRGTTGHLVLAHTREATGAPITHVPYKGGGQQISDALGGQFDLLSSNLGAQQLAHVRQGRLRAFALGAPGRLASLPEVPTFAELGLPQANLVSTFGLFAPGATDPALVQAINAACQPVLDEAAFRQRLASTDNQPLGGPPHDLAQRIRHEAEATRALWARQGLRDTF